MPTMLLDKLLPNLFLQTLVHPEDPSANLVSTNLKLSQSSSQIFWQKPSITSLVQIFQD